MIYFSHLLKTNPTYKNAADRLFAALDLFNINYKFIKNTKDIWARDYMPVKTKSDRFISFRYEPNYLKENPELRTDFRKEIVPALSLENLIYSDINLDGGNVVFSPLKEKVIISDRVFDENKNKNKTELIDELEKLLEAHVIIIPSLKSDMTGHADGMVRFVDENTVIGNASDFKYGLEIRIKTTLKMNGIEVIDFPYFESKGDSAVGCYLNFLETEQIIFLPVFDVDMDKDAINTAKDIFNKKIVTVNINEIAKNGGVLNCISWET